LGRYGFDANNLCRSGLFEQLSKTKIKSIKYPEMDKISFMTIHGAKGLGFDNVVLLNMSEGTYGFPCRIEDDPIMKLVIAHDNKIPFAEERRLFYVALTRTKNRVYIAAPIRKPSRFLIELIKDFKLPYPHNMNTKIVDPVGIPCPNCGYPLKFESNKNYGMSLYMCTNDPEVCEFMTDNLRYKRDIEICSVCRDGYMIAKKNKETGELFYGCTNYKKNGPAKCENTKPIL